MPLLECCFGVYVARCIATREIRTKITLPWLRIKQFAMTVHTVSYFLHNIVLDVYGDIQCHASGRVSDNKPCLNKPLAQIPQWTVVYRQCVIFKRNVYICEHLSCKMEHYELWVWCIVCFAQQVYCGACASYDLPRHTPIYYSETCP